MKTIVLAVLLSLPAAESFGQVLYVPPVELPWKLGMGFQLSGSNLFLLSWQSPDQNHYGRSWRIEPMIGGSLSDYDAVSSSNASLTVGLGTYLRWRVRAPFDDLYFQMGPRVLLTGYRTKYWYQPYPDSLPQIKQTSEYMSTSVSFLLGPEYEIDKWQQHFSIAGFLIVTGSITGQATESPTIYSPSTWSLNLSTGTGIVLRYYFD